jgi:hypothetical protein
MQSYFLKMPISFLLRIFQNYLRLLPYLGLHFILILFIQNKLLASLYDWTHSHFEMFYALYQLGNFSCTLLSLTTLGFILIYIDNIQKDTISPLRKTIQDFKKSCLHASACLLLINCIILGGYQLLYYGALRIINISLGSANFLQLFCISFLFWFNLHTFPRYWLDKSSLKHGIRTALSCCRKSGITQWLGMTLLFMTLSFILSMIQILMHHNGSILEYEAVGMQWNFSFIMLPIIAYTTHRFYLKNTIAQQ